MTVCPLQCQTDQPKLRRLNKARKTCSSQGQQLEYESQPHLYAKHSSKCFSHMISGNPWRSPMGSFFRSLFGIGPVHPEGKHQNKDLDLGLTPKPILSPLCHIAT